jgi:hypothetical protein
LGHHWRHPLIASCNLSIPCSAWQSTRKFRKSLLPDLQLIENPNRIAKPENQGSTLTSCCMVN